MSIAIITAIKTHWKTKVAPGEIGAIIDGDTNLFLGQALGTVPRPYCVVTIISNVPGTWTSDSEYRDQTIQFAIFDNTFELVGAHQTQLFVDMDFAAIILPAANVSAGEVVIDVKRLSDLIMPGDVQQSAEVGEIGTWQAVTVYEYARTLDKN